MSNPTSSSSDEKTIIKLYMIPGSSSLFPHILLRYAQLDFTPMPVRREDLASEEYRREVNDKAQVPVLHITTTNTNGSNSSKTRTVTENPAIAFTIHELAPKKNLFGTTPEEHSAVMERLSWMASSVHAQAWGPYIRPWRFTDPNDEAAQAVVKETSKRKLVEQFTRLEEKLEIVNAGPFVLGEKFTAVDAYVLMFFRLAAKLLQGVDMFQSFPRWAKVVEEVEKLDFVRETLEFEAKLVSDPVETTRRT